MLMVKCSTSWQSFLRQIVVHGRMTRFTVARQDPPDVGLAIEQSPRSGVWKEIPLLEIKVRLEPVDDQVVTGRSDEISGEVRIACLDRFNQSGRRLGLAVLSGAALLAITFASVVATPRMITWAVARALTIVILVGRVPVSRSA
jgi:hypothetical protein